MAFKLGDHVRVKPGVSRRKDVESLRLSAQHARNLDMPEIADQGMSRKQFEGKVGTIVQIGDQVHPIKVREGTRDGQQVTVKEVLANEAPATVPPGHEGQMLVDSQVQPNGFREGGLDMREWFSEAELEAAT